MKHRPKEVLHMIDISKLNTTAPNQACALPCFDPSYLDVLFDDTDTVYAVYTYLDIINGNAPLTETEALEQMTDIISQGAPTIPMIIETTIDKDQLRHTLLPLYLYPFDEDFVKWQKFYISTAPEHMPVPELFTPVALNASTLTASMIDNLACYLEKEGVDNG